MLTLQDLAAGIREITAEDPPIVRVWQHSVGFSVYVEAHGHQFLFGIGDPAGSRRDRRHVELGEDPPRGSGRGARVRDRCR